MHYQNESNFQLEPVNAHIIEHQVEDGKATNQNRTFSSKITKEMKSDPYQQKGREIMAPSKPPTYLSQTLFTDTVACQSVGIGHALHFFLYTLI